MNRITSPHRYNRYLYPTVAGTNVFAADSVYDALRQSGRRLWWDADGNLSREYYRYKPSLGEEERMERRLCHTEEGMMQGYWQDDNDETVGAWYAYDADGHRALKYASERAAGSAQSVVELCDPVYYVSPLVTLTRTGYSKHYFEGGRRICTVIGGGFGLVPWDSVTSDPMPVVGPHDDKLAKVLLMGAESTFGNCIGVRAYLSNTLALYKTMLNESERYETHEPAFYYHTDHLGSTSRFTDDSGKVVQTLAYMPYGEDWVDDSKFIYSDTNHIGIYQFNGKERDFESGFYYYGARYHWPELWTGWTSPDPLMDKYPGISPYNYCTWNPVIFVDPDGRATAPIYDRKGNFLGTDNQGLQGKAIVMDKEKFRQGMNHEEALSFNLGEKGLYNRSAVEKLYRHYDGLLHRPDYDGFVTISEGIKWAKKHPNALQNTTPDNTLYINAGLLDLGNLTIGNSGLEAGGDYKNVNLLKYVNLKSLRSIRTTYALGNTSMRLLDNNGTVEFSGDKYDWDYHKNSQFRNTLIYIERLRKGLNDNHGFNIRFYGTGTIKK